MSAISIIVPVYNIEKYLSCCIDSILNQSFIDFELLLIDDGSTDDSGTICDVYAERDSRIRVFHKKNGGASSARNVGLDNANGEWVTFVDGDDTVGVCYIEHLMSNKMDLAIAGLQHCSNGKVKVIAPKEEKHVKMLDFSARWNIQKMNYLYCYPVAKRYRNSIIIENNIRFKENLFYQEDLFFVLSYLLCIDGFIELPYADYKYGMREIDRANKFKMNANQLIAHHDALCGLFDQMELKCEGSFNYVMNNVNLRLLRCFYSYLQNCSDQNEYMVNSRLFRKQRWAKLLLGLLQGKREKRVLYGAYYCPRLSFLFENKFLGVIH